MRMIKSALGILSNNESMSYWISRPGQIMAWQMPSEGARQSSASGVSLQMPGELLSKKVYSSRNFEASLSS